MGDDLWAWQVQEPDGKWSMVAATVPGLDQLMPMVHRKKDVMLSLEWLARQHADGTGQELRLAHFALLEAEKRPTTTERR